MKSTDQLSASDPGHLKSGITLGCMWKAQPVINKSGTLPSTHAW